MIGFAGTVDGERLRAAAQAVVARHDILRAAFAETANGPCQIVLARAELAALAGALDAAVAVTPEAKDCYDDT
ncbi:hypothetical protein, partial [Nocardia farcinica]|uniref:hypothetical protein n=1 Tax=Nocardia farcinica TaxID=37329 RepID=UPI002454C797